MSDENPNKRLKMDETTATTMTSSSRNPSTPNKAEEKQVPPTPPPAKSEGKNTKSAITDTTATTITTTTTTTTTTDMASMLTDGLSNEKDPMVVQETLRTLAKLWYNSKSNCQHASELGAPLSLVTVLKKYSTSLEINSAAILCVLHMTYFLEPVRILFLDLGLLELLVNAMKTFSGEPKLHEDACNVLHNLFLGDNSRRSAAAGGGGAAGRAKKMKAEAQRFQDLGGIESLVQTLTTFAYPQEMEKPHHFNIYMNVCAVLQNLVLLGMRQPILQSGAVRVLALIFESKANNKHHKKELEKTVKEVMKHLFEK